MASLGNGATFGWDLENGTVESGVWYPNPKAQMIQGPPLTAEQRAQRAAEDRARLEDERRKAKAREEEEDRLHADLSRAMAEQIKKRIAEARGQPTGSRPVPDISRHSPPPHSHSGSRSVRPDADPWAKTHPMSWGTADMTVEAMDRRWGSGWEEGGAYRRIEVVEERRDARGLGLVTSGLGLGLDLGQPGNWRSSGGLMVPTGSGGSSGSGSASASTSMGRSGSDESNTSVSASGSAVGTSYPQLPPVTGVVGRRGSEPVLRPPELAAWTSAPVVSGPGFKSSPDRPVPTRPSSSGSVKSSVRSQAPAARGSTSPYRVPATLSRGQGRGRGSPPYTHRVREQSPLGDRPGRRELDVASRHAENGAPFAINSAVARHPANYAPASAGYQSFAGARPPLREMVPVGNPWSVSAGGAPFTVSALGDTFFPPPLMRVDNPVYLMDEPILVWGGSTGVGRAALQLLKRAGYTNLFVVAASERHAELREIVPSGTR